MMMKSTVRSLVIGCFVTIMFSCTGSEGEIEEESHEAATQEVPKEVCNSGKVEKEILDDSKEISIIYRYFVDDFAVAFTNQTKEKWEDEVWIEDMYQTLNTQTDFNVVIIFDDHHHTPNLNLYCLNYPPQFNRNLVMGYWRYKDGQNKFCYGGPKVDGTFYHCVYKD